MKSKLVVLSLLLLSAAALAQSVQSTTEVLVGTTATALPQLGQRRGVEIQNLGPNPIFCALGSSAAAVVNKARKVDAGAAWALNAPSTQTIWCVASTAAQVTGAATVVTEIR